MSRRLRPRYRQMVGDMVVSYLTTE
jgi:hypothetical protein